MENKTDRRIEKVSVTIQQILRIGSDLEDDSVRSEFSQKLLKALNMKRESSSVSTFAKASLNTIRTGQATELILNI